VSICFFPQYSETYSCYCFIIGGYAALLDHVLKLSRLIDIHFNWCRESWLKFTLAARVKYVGLKFKPVSMFKLYMLLQMCLYMFSIYFAITELVYFHGCVCHVQNHYANWNSIVGKGNLWCFVWAKSEIVWFVFSDFWNNHAYLSSPELFNWPAMRDHITYFINFVLDLHLILKVYFYEMYQLVGIIVYFYIT